MHIRRLSNHSCSDGELFVELVVDFGNKLRHAEVGLSQYIQAIVGATDVSVCSVGRWSIFADPIQSNPLRPYIWY